jgi:hypothetical protein
MTAILSHLLKTGFLFRVTFLCAAQRPVARAEKTGQYSSRGTSKHRAGKKRGELSPGYPFLKQNETTRFGGLANAGSAQATGRLLSVLTIILSRKNLRALLPDKGNIFDIMPKEGLEPSYPCGYTSLSRARLPVPPLRLSERPNFTTTKG